VHPVCSRTATDPPPQIYRSFLKEIGVSAGKFDLFGAFPVRGPLTYLPLTQAEIRAARSGPFRCPVAWYHRTGEAEAASAAWQGLIPSCWVGKDGCCVFGVDGRDAGSRLRGDWVLEIVSSALPEQQKAWWVPPAAIRGAWHDGVFHEADDLRSRGGPLLHPAGSCSCELAAVVAEEVACWRALAVAE
jgi:hypothetical protein